MPSGEELGRIQRQVVSLRPKVVINNIQEHHQIFRMCRVDQVFKVIRTPVTACRCKGKNSVVSPITLSGEIRNWHEFNRRHTKACQIIQFGFYSRKCPFCRKSPDMQLINHRFIPTTSLPLESCQSNARAQFGMPQYVFSICLAFSTHFVLLPPPTCSKSFAA